MIRKHIVVHGRVQGVGFRYITSSIAVRCHVTGWVRNEYDGTVTIEVQGAEHRVALFIEQVSEGNRFARVDHLDITEMPLVNASKETGFQIVH